jgi:hypothetical protein
MERLREMENMEANYTRPDRHLQRLVLSPAESVEINEKRPVITAPSTQTRINAGLILAKVIARAG